ncbi:MAG: hypothetical protein ACUVRD_09365 [Bacteroidia bacterium]
MRSLLLTLGFLAPLLYTQNLKQVVLYSPALADDRAYEVKVAMEKLHLPATVYRFCDNTLHLIVETSDPARLRQALDQLPYQLEWVDVPVEKILSGCISKHDMRKPFPNLEGGNYEAR